jgi:transcription-repair coupling factor (superfamily II helicase)
LPAAAPPASAAAPASGAFARAAAALGSGAAPVEIVGAVGGFAGFVLAAVRQALPRTLLVVTPDDTRAQEIRLALEFFEPGSDLLEPVLPFWPLDHSPYSGMSPSRLRVMERVATLFRLAHDLEVACVVVPAKALLDRVMPAQALLERARLLAPGDRLDRDGFLAFLAETGYHPVPAVEDPGTFALRGGIIDVFSPLSEYPLRIELWGDEIDTLRFFDPTTQRTLRSVDTVMLGPARDIVFDAESVQRARQAVRDLADELHVPSTRARALVDDLDAGILAVGMEELLPAFWPALDALWDVAPPDTIWLIDEPEACEEAMLARWHEVTHAAERVRSEGGELAFPAEALYVPAAEAIAAMHARARGRLVAFSTLDRADAVSLRFNVEDNADIRRAIEDATQKREDQVLSPLTQRVRNWREAGHAVVVCAHSEGSVERLRGLLAHYGLTVDRYDQPFHLGLVGDYVVHADHGRSAATRASRSSSSPAARATSSSSSSPAQDKLYLPVYKLGRLQKYAGAGQADPRIDKLGGTAWQKVRSKARAQAEEDARPARPLRPPRDGQGLPVLPRTTTSAPSKAPSPSTRPPIRPAPSKKSSPTWSAPARWTACSAATSASARPRSPCAPR